MMRQLLNSTAGTSVIEFALALPLFVFAVVGGMELAWTAMQHQRVQRIAATSADNAARERGSIDETDIHEIMAAVKTNGESLNIEEQGTVIISSIQRNSDNNGNWIRWQRCIGKDEYVSEYGREGKGQNDRSLQGVGKNRTMNPPQGVALILAEVFYDNEPLITDSYFEQKTFKYQTAFIVRDRNDLSLGNATSLPNGQKLTC